jgi:signal transduction histidine kinase
MTVRRFEGWRPVVADPRTADGALVAVCLFLTVLAAKTPWSALPWPVIAVSGAVGSLAQLLRRGRPLMSAVFGAAALTLSGNPGPWLIGLYSGAAYAARLKVAAAALAGWAGLTGYLWLESGRAQPTDALAAAAATVVVVFAGVYLATRRALVAMLRERAEHAEAERLLREDKARTAERDRIAREMHDLLAHKVSLIALHAGALELRAEKDPARATQTAGLIRVTAREALQELRTVLGMLHAESETAQEIAGQLGHGESVADLAALVEASAKAGQPVRLQDSAGSLPPATARVVYRIVQEGLTNAHRYAPGAHTTVAVEREPGEGPVRVAVSNGPGRGAPTDLPGSGSGLVGLAERIRLVGGAIECGPLGRDGGGWRISAVVPWLDRQIEDGS